MISPQKVSSSSVRQSSTVASQQATMLYTMAQPKEIDLQKIREVENHAHDGLPPSISPVVTRHDIKNA